MLGENRIEAISKLRNDAKNIGREFDISFPATTPDPTIIIAMDMDK